MGLDFILLSEKLAGIREKFIKAVDKILDASDGEPFYGRIFLNGDERLVGLIKNLRVNEHQVKFSLIEERLVDDKVVRKTKGKKVAFEKIRRIEVYKTQNGRPISIDEEEVK